MSDVAFDELFKSLTGHLSPRNWQRRGCRNDLPEQDCARSNWAWKDGRGVGFMDLPSPSSFR